MSFTTNLLRAALPMVIAPRQFHNLLHAAVHNPLLHRTVRAEKIHMKAVPKTSKDFSLEIP
jgi:hypothetical protein